MKINTNNYAEVTEILQEISRLASKKINEIYSDDFKEFRKEDNSPVTVAIDGTVTSLSLIHI